MDRHANTEGVVRDETWVLVRLQADPLQQVEHMAHTILSLARKVADTLVDELGDIDLKRDHEAAKDLLTDRLVSIFTAEALRRATTKLEG